MTIPMIFFSRAGFRNRGCAAFRLRGATKRRSRLGAARVGATAVSSLSKKPPGEGTGPTIHVDLRRNPVGRVPSHGERDVFERAARANVPRLFAVNCVFVVRPASIRRLV